jgi:predicted GTPase
LKAGKSTLFNAIIGGEKFETSVVRATKRIQEEKLKNFILIDTPGLDACEQDTEIALQGYRNADIIVFVHNVQEGEFNQVEIDSINKIAGIFGDRSSFFRNAILVLTHKDQMEDECDRIQKQIEQQSQSILNSQFSKIISVNSEGYIRGVAENKQLLIEDSGIPNLIQELNDRIKKVSDLRRSLFDLERKKLINKLEAEITDVREKTPVVDRTKVNEIDRLIAYNKSVISNVKETIDGMKVDVSHTGSYRWCARDENSYKGYKWSFQAEDAAKEAIRKTIKETASRVKTDAVRIVDEAEKYITPSKVPSDVRKKLSTAYEQMRKEALKYDVSVKTDFNIKIHIPEDSNYALDPARSNARDINSASFYSVDHYAKYNITIKDFKTYETVQTIFGPIDREVTKYNYYAYGAMDDIAEDAERLMRDVMYDVSSGINSVFKTIKDDLWKQFKQITDFMNKELINEKKNREQVISQKENEKKLCENYLAQLENIRNEVMSL